MGAPYGPAEGGTRYWAHCCRGSVEEGEDCLWIRRGGGVSDSGCDEEA